MTIEEARAVKAGDEVPYGEKPIEALAEYLPNLDKAIRSATDEETAFALEIRRRRADDGQIRSKRQGFIEDRKSVV